MLLPTNTVIYQIMQKQARSYLHNFKTRQVYKHHVNSDKHDRYTDTSSSF